MERCDAYRHFAAQCLELVRSMDSPQDRAILLQMALIWSRLAECAAQGGAGAQDIPDPKSAPKGASKAASKPAPSPTPRVD